MSILDAVFGLVLLVAQSPPAAAPVEPSPAAPQSMVDVAEVDIVDGNVVGAKKRALEEAFLRAVERVFAAELADAGLPVAGPLSEELTKLRAGFPLASRRYIRSYRVVEETEVAGKLRVGVDAVVDKAFLRRQIEKTRVAAPTSNVASAVYVSGNQGAGAMAPAVAEALRAAGLVVSESAGPADAFRLSVRGHSQVSGEVRGAGLVAARCQVETTVQRPGGGREVVLPSSGEWGFGPEKLAAEKACVDRLAPLAAQTVLPVVQEAQSASRGKPVHVTFDLIEPVALERLLRRLRRVGTISRFELRRIAVGVADVRMETNLAADALGTALIAALGDELTLTKDQVAGDQLRMTLRVRADVAPAVAPEDAIEAP